MIQLFLDLLAPKYLLAR